MILLIVGIVMTRTGRKQRFIQIKPEYVHKDIEAQDTMCLNTDFGYIITTKSSAKLK